MPLISQSISGLFNGVSQQAPSLRKETQCEEQINGYSSIERGVEKRPPSEHKFKLNAITSSDLHSHTIIRDEIESYQIICSGNNLYAYDLNTGDSVPIYDGSGNILSNPAYLSNVTNHRTQISLTTVADYTFLLNKNKTVAMTSTVYNPTKTMTYESSSYYNSYLYLTQPQYGVDYIVKVGSYWYKRKIANQLTTTPFKLAATDIFEDGSDGTTGSPGTNVGHSSEVSTNGGVTWTSTTTAMYDYFVANTDIIDPKTTFSLSENKERAKGSLYRFLSTTDLPLEAEDSFGNNTMIVYKDVIQEADKLPEKAWEGVRWQVTGEAGSKAQANGSFYVIYEDGAWIETTGWNQKNDLDTNTMPHLLRSYLYDSSTTYYRPDGITTVTVSGLSNGDPFFLYDYATWSDRLVGDDNTVPLPSFIDSTISDIFFYRNRLGFVSKENVILSRASKFFNFFPTTATDVFDDDPIDLAVSTERITKLNYAVPHAEDLVLFSNFTQFKLTSDGNFTPYSARVEIATQYESSPLAKPIGLGSNVYFTVPQGDYTGVREYYTNQQSNVQEANDVTSHVPRYIPKNVFKMTGSSNEDIMFLLTEEEPNNIYVYQYFFTSEGKAQDAWHKWTFEEDVNVLDMYISDAVLSLVVQRSNGIYIEQVNLKSGTNDAGLDFRLLIDRKASTIDNVVTSSYDAGTNKTTFTLPYEDTDVILVVTSGEFDDKADILDTTVEGVDQLSVVGDYTGGTVYVGKNYEFKYVFSEFYYKEQSLANDRLAYKSHYQEVKFILNRFFIDYIDSGRFSIFVDITGRTLIEQENAGRLGTSEIIIGNPLINSGTANVYVGGSSDKVTIYLINDSLLPSIFQSAEIRGQAMKKSYRI